MTTDNKQKVISRKFKAAFERSALTVENFTSKELALAEKYFYSDEAIYQGKELFSFYDSELEREESDNSDVVWIHREEWNFARGGLHYGIIDSYSLYSKNGEDYVLFRILYSPGIIKLIRFQLTDNNPIACAIIDYFGHVVNLKELPGNYINFYVSNKYDNKGDIYSTIVSFDFISDEEYDFVEQMYKKISKIICDVADEA